MDETAEWLAPINEKWAAKWNIEISTFNEEIEEYLAERIVAMERMMVTALQEKRVHFKDL